MKKDLKKIKKIDLRQYNLQSNQSTISLSQIVSGKFPNLQEVQLSYNHISSLPQFNLTNLKILNCYNMQIFTIHQFAKRNYPNLREICFDTNNLESLPLLKTPQLKKLQCKYNKISQLSQFAQGYYPQLQNLDLSHNNLKQFPEFHMVKLKLANFSQNKILKMNSISFSPFLYNPIQKRSVSSLRTLLIYSNNIQNLQCLSFSDFRKLRKISIISNKITNFSSLDKCKFPALQDLFIGANESYVFNLSRMKSPKISSLNLQVEWNKNIKIQEINALAKLQTNSIKFYIFQYRDVSIIQQLISRISLKSKFIGIKDVVFKK